ncbi:MAG: dephospho-CoA kinase [Gammaproteobacteria bacterium]|nr:dephospho-CoA kinase [Gammaproteobacteria bacterium]
MVTIGLTGGVGCGKSTVAALFEKRGAPVVDADVITRELTAHGAPALQRIVETFGAHLLLPDGQLDRRALRGLVFDRPRARHQLEAILHPRVREEISRRLSQLCAPYGIAVIPLLVESGMQNTVDRVLVVDCEEIRQVERVSTRDGCTPAAVRAIIATQAPRDARRAVADDIIVNDDVADPLEAEVERLHTQYLALAAGRDRSA